MIRFVSSSLILGFEKLLLEFFSVTGSKSRSDFFCLLFVKLDFSFLIKSSSSKAECFGEWWLITWFFSLMLSRESSWKCLAGSLLLGLIWWSRVRFFLHSRCLLFEIFLLFCGLGSYLTPKFIALDLYSSIFLPVETNPSPLSSTSA